MKITKAEKFEMDYTQYTERAIDARLETIKALVAKFGRTPELEKEFRRLYEEKASRR